MNINRNLLNKFLKSIAHQIRKSFKGSNVIWFGSTLNPKNVDIHDIDIMIIIKGEKKSKDFEIKLKSLRNQILYHDFAEGFKIHNENLAHIINQQIANFGFKNLMLKQVFGPIMEPYSDTKESKNCYMHIKGPISEEEFKLFCIYFPFHAKSIINNHNQLYGDVNIKEFERYIYFSEDELTLWAKSLKRRFDNFQFLFQKKKCLNKIVHMIDLYVGEKIIDDNFLSYNEVQNNNEYVDNNFFKAYNKCLNYGKNKFRTHKVFK